MQRLRFGEKLQEEAKKSRKHLAVSKIMPTFAPAFAGELMRASLFAR
jgi:hypothetical protein